MKKVSIIIPIYNVDKYLNQCLKSVTNQSHINLEIILVNDGSSDDSGKIADKYAKEDRRIIVIHQVNSGVSAARNAGIKKATGEYICFVDGDDYVDSHLVEFMCNIHSDLVVCGLNINGKKFLPKNYIISKNIKEHTLTSVLLKPQLIHSAYCKMFNRAIIDRNNVHFDEECNHGEDLLFILQYVNYCKDIKYISKSLYYYRLTNNGLMAQESKKINKKKYLYQKINTLTGYTSILPKLIIKIIYLRWLLSICKNIILRRSK